MYSVKEIFYTLQGEGAQAGRAAVFCRFSGCNLWSGKEADRNAALCRFCDTDFVGTDGPNGAEYHTADDLAAAIFGQWKGGQSLGARPFVVLTGGEPLLQLDAPLISAIHGYGMEIAVETNGTIAVPNGVDWICVSPKAHTPLRQICGQELKVVVPQHDLDLDFLSALKFDHFFVQPMAGNEYLENCRTAVEFCLAHPKWRVSVQMHKHLAIA